MRRFLLTELYIRYMSYYTDHITTNEEMGGIGWPSILGCLFGSAFFLVIVFGLLYRFFRGRVRPQRAVPAILLGKETVTNPLLPVYGRYPAVSSRHLLTFKMNGSIRKFDASPLLYDRMEPGNRGILHYQGSRAVDFDIET